MKKKINYKWKVVKKKSHTSMVISSRSPYCLTYKKGTIVEALKGTLGIMVFNTRKNAESWSYIRSGTIKRVIPIGKGKYPTIVCNSLVTRALVQFYKYMSQGGVKYDSLLQFGIPEGTMCYPAVEVVD